uniref:Si:dkey-83h2.3 n=1 Tax=Myripristis murdjan TaxID=586833 RepID=A0A668AT37_9TELE
MCVSGCLRCVGLMLVPLAVVCMLANVLLLLPGLQVHFLLEGHVTREATWATGLWGSGLLVRADCVCACVCVCVGGQLVYSCVCVLAAGFCSLVSGTGLVNGPLCLHNTSSGPAWGVPFKTTGDGGQVYLFERSLWSSVCLQPAGVVQWNVTLFSVLGGASALQTLLCTANILNTLLILLINTCGCHGNIYQRN